MYHFVEVGYGGSNPLFLADVLIFSWSYRSCIATNMLSCSVMLHFIIFIHYSLLGLKPIVHIIPIPYGILYNYYDSIASFIPHRDSRVHSEP